MKRKTTKLLEVNETTMLLALEYQLDVELNILSEILRVAARSISRVNVLETAATLTVDVKDSVVSISQLRQAILEIKDNNPELQSRLVKDMTSFAADDIPF